MTPSSAAVAGQAVAVATGLLALGYLIADGALRRSRADTVIRWALAFPALCLWALALTLAHVATGGAVLSSPQLVRGLTAGLALALAAGRMIRGRPAPRAGWRAGLGAAAVAAVALGVWGPPLLEVFPLGRPAADTGWHTGWAQQLMSGLALPGAPIAGEVPNYYPWLFHGLLATIARLTPGGTAFHALGPLQLLQVAGTALALFALGREVAGRWLHGATTAVFGSVAAGFGLVALAIPSLLERTPQVGGPRLTYHASWHGLAPALPRDVALALLCAFLLASAVALRGGGAGWFPAAGALLGATGLTSPEAFFVGVGAAVMIALVPGTPSRPWRLAALLGPALALWSLWLVPLAASYLRLGGFVNTTILNPPDPTPAEVVLSWGWSIPLGLWGLIVWLPRMRTERSAAVPAGLLAGAAVTVAASALIPGLLGQGFDVLGRARRYWPLFQLAVAVYAGLGAADLLARVRLRPGLRAAGAVAGGALILAMTIPLPLRVSLDLGESTPPSPAVESALREDRTAVVSLVAAAGAGPCVVAAPARLSVPIFSVTGYRLVAYAGRQAARPGNAARIRWTDIYEVTQPEALRRRDNLALVEGRAEPPEMRRIVQAYGIDVVVADRDARAARLAALGAEPAASSDGYRVYLLGRCDA